MAWAKWLGGAVTGDQGDRGYVVIKAEADRAVERPRLPDVAGEQYEGGQLGHWPARESISK